MTLDSSAKRSLFGLALCQALAMSMSSLLIASSALVGIRIAENPQWATIPLGMMFTTSMLLMYPSSLLMQRFGRQAGLKIGATSMLCSGLVCALGIYNASLLLFTCGMMLFGVAMSFFQYIRFAAIDAVPKKVASTAIAWVLSGGLIAAFMGPALANYAKDLWSTHPFMASYLLGGALAVLLFIIASRLALPLPSADEISGEMRPWRVLLKQKRLLVSVIAATVAYGLMNLLMTATPLSMHHDGRSFGETAMVIQWHIVGMFLPSFFTGKLIDKIGVLWVMLFGCVCYLAVVTINLNGQKLAHYWLALVCLGVGWNFLFMGGTQLLSTAYLPAEKGRVQGLNDTLVFTATALTAFSSGWLFDHLNWRVLNLVTLPVTGLVLCLLVYLLIRQRYQKPAHVH